MVRSISSAREKTVPRNPYHPQKPNFYLRPIIPCPTKVTASSARPQLHTQSPHQQRSGPGCTPAAPIHPPSANELPRSCQTGRGRASPFVISGRTTWAISPADDEDGDMIRRPLNYCVQKPSTAWSPLLTKQVGNSGDRGIETPCGSLEVSDTFLRGLCGHVHAVSDLSPLTLFVQSVTL